MKKKEYLVLATVPASVWTVVQATSAEEARKIALTEAVDEGYGWTPEGYAYEAGVTEDSQITEVTELPEDETFEQP